MPSGGGAPCGSLAGAPATWVAALQDAFPDVEWLAETGADAPWEIVSAEEVLSAPLFDGRVQLQGKLDLRARRKSDGVRAVWDHKTLATFASDF